MLRGEKYVLRIKLFANVNTEMTLVFIHHRNGLIFSNDLKILYTVFLLFVTPLYLLLTYRYFRAKNCIPFAKGIVFMLLVVTEDPIRDGENWYVYAGNNPVNFVDADGLADRFWVDLGKGWKACIDSENVQNGTQRHVHIVKGSKSYSQNDDGSPHDKNKNSRGKPPKSVLKNLKKKMKWDYEKKEKTSLSLPHMSTLIQNW